MRLTIEALSAETLDELQSSLGVEKYVMTMQHMQLKLEIFGLDVLKTNSAKSLGNGLYEFRFRRDPNVLVRVFFAVLHPSRIVILDGYDKKRDPSDLTQRREIKKARKLLEELRSGEIQ